MKMKSVKLSAPKKPSLGKSRNAVQAAPVPEAPAVKSFAPGVTPEQRRKMIEAEAYFIAERNKFQGDPKTFWAMAERAVNARLKAL